MSLRRALLAFCVALPAAVLAQGHLGERPMAVRWEGGSARVSFDARDLVDAATREELSGGIRKELVVTTQVFRRGRDRVLASRRYTCGVTFDLWEEHYVVDGGPSGGRVAVGDVQAVLDRCLRPRDLAVGTASDYRGGPYTFAVRAEFNPIGWQRCRELLRSPASDDPLGPVVVNIVRREICRADRSVQFRSSPRSGP